MREIKFRAWDKNNKGFINGFNMFGFSNGQGAPKRNLKRYSNQWNEEDIELMQYTGLKDKNGKEIYEGDIIKIDETEEIDVVNWSDGGEFAIGFGLFSCFQYEVIGDIYENPNLLKEVL